MRAFSKVIIKICVGAIALGVLLIIIGVASGAKDNFNWRKNFAENKNLVDFNEEYENINALDINLQYGDVQIVQGDRFRIEGYDLWKDSFTSEVVDGVWKIKDEGVEDFGHWSLRVWPLNVGFNGDYTPSITIYLPKDFEAEKFKLEMGAGTVTIDSLISKQSTYIGVSAGEIVIDDLEAVNSTIKCGAGNVEISGNILGDSKVDCNVGRVELNLDGSESDYNYKVDCDLGSVSINGNDYEFSPSVNKSSDDAENELDLTCNIGEIVVNTEN